MEDFEGSFEMRLSDSLVTSPTVDFTSDEKGSPVFEGHTQACVMNESSIDRRRCRVEITDSCTKEAPATT